MTHHSTTPFPPFPTSFQGSFCSAPRRLCGDFRLRSLLFNTLSQFVLIRAIRVSFGFPGFLRRIPLPHPCFICVSSVAKSIARSRFHGFIIWIFALLLARSPCTNTATQTLAQIFLLSNRSPQQSGLANESLQHRQVRNPGRNQRQPDSKLRQERHIPQIKPRRF